MGRTLDLSREDYRTVPFTTDEAGQGQLDFGFTEAPFHPDQCRDREDIQSTGGSESQAYSPAPRRSGPLKNVQASQINATFQLIEQLTTSIPLNEYKLPLFIYRPDMLDHTFVAKSLAAGGQSTTPTSVGPAQRAGDGLEELDAHLNAAVVPLTYNEGYPVTPAGIPFWSKLEFEPQSAYDAFIEYLELGGARQISSLQAFDLDEVREFFHMFYWTFRVKAFDLYKVAHHQQQKLQRMLSTEDNHYIMAQQLVNRVYNYLQTTDLNEETITPDKAVAMLEKLVKVQRISVGLPANGESKENTGNNRQVTPVNVIMQQISQTNEATTDNQTNGIDLLLENPDSVDLAQQLIIRLNGGE